jgi:hypothetical protein
VFVLVSYIGVSSRGCSPFSPGTKQTSGGNMFIDASWLPLVLDRGCLGLPSRELAPELHTHGAHRTSKTPTISVG